MENLYLCVRGVYGVCFCLYGGCVFGVCVVCGVCVRVCCVYGWVRACVCCVCGWVFVVCVSVCVG